MKNLNRRHGGFFGISIPRKTADSMVKLAVDIEKRTAIVLNQVYEIWRTADEKASGERD